MDDKKQSQQFSLSEYHGSKPFSFGGKKIVYSYYPKTSRKSINDKLLKSDTYTTFKKYRKQKYTSPYFVYEKDALWQADLCFFLNPQQIEATGGFKYLLVIIDTFTRFCWLYPMKTKQCSEVLKHFIHCFREVGTAPQKLQTDSGLEFKCSKLSTFLNDKEVFHYFAFSDRKCPHVERLNRTLQDLLYKKMDHFQRLDLDTWALVRNISQIKEQE